MAGGTVGVLSLSLLSHPDRQVALAVQNAPQVDVVFAFYIEQQIGIIADPPEAQFRQIKLMSISKRTGGRVQPDVVQSLFKRINECAGYDIARCREIIVQRLFNVARGLFARNDGPGFHAGRRLTIRALRESK